MARPIPPTPEEIETLEQIIDPKVWPQLNTATAPDDVGIIEMYHCPQDEVDGWRGDSTMAHHGPLEQVWLIMVRDGGLSDWTLTRQDVTIDQITAYSDWTAERFFNVLYAYCIHHGWHGRKYGGPRSVKPYECHLVRR